MPLDLETYVHNPHFRSKSKIRPRYTVGTQGHTYLSNALLILKITVTNNDYGWYSTHNKTNNIICTLSGIRRAAVGAERVHYAGYLRGRAATSGAARPEVAGAGGLRDWHLPRQTRPVHAVLW